MTQRKRKRRHNTPRHKRMKRPARLQAAKVWLAAYTGKYIASAYKKHFNVDLLCAITELQMLGVKFEEEYVKQVQRSAEAQQEKRRKKREEAASKRVMSEYEDDDFAFVAGYTEGGAPYGVRRDEVEAMESRILQGPGISLKKEIAFIVGRALAGDSRLVRWGSLLLFSTKNGDAWMLDPSDDLAMCLARDGREVAPKFVETTKNFAIEWELTFGIKTGRFIVTDHDGRSIVLDGYPVGRILEFIDDCSDDEIPF